MAQQQQQMMAQQQSFQQQSMSSSQQSASFQQGNFSISSKNAIKMLIYPMVRKVVIGCVTCSGHNQARNPRAWILPFWSKTDMDSLKQNLCLAPSKNG